MPSFCLVLENNAVRWAVFPFVVSVIMLPMKAYITEDFPWIPTNKPISDNFTEFNTNTLAMYQIDYNRYTLPSNTKFYEDPIRKLQISQEILDT
ncbi:hypothetical protein THRCLA_20452 [Thraustotheca clavata]|uniref:Uncharacterized protein n=1 Tax=Thraustotheca clavata TaxID=74557 RepID=A0A1W0A7T4_9STRA|nr:hypothetical protein THRCLA_20452 [Thraustotheca clavata]